MEGQRGTHLEAMADSREAFGRMDMRVAADIDGYLATRAGLAQGWCSEYASKCNDAGDIAAYLNELYLGDALCLIKVVPHERASLSSTHARCEHELYGDGKGISAVFGHASTKATCTIH